VLIAACGREAPNGASGSGSAGEGDAQQRVRALQDELPARLEQEAGPFLSWVANDLYPGAGRERAKEMLWVAINPGCNSADLGKLSLALDSIGVFDETRFFKRSDRPREVLPEIEYVPVPAGTFLMGSPPGERGRSDAEGPQHRVDVPGFQLAARPVTNAQFELFDPRHAREEWSGVTDLDDHPVVNVSWWDAYVFCRWLGARLPSEAEWEYACRAGTTTRFSAGDNAADLARVGWVFDNSEQRPHAVGAKPPNAWGLFDMHGNVFEWCRDAWHTSYEGAPMDGSPWTDPLEARRVHRGGAWLYYPEYARSAHRGGRLPTERNNHLGFRVARDP
jgi:formylglycine-generating enzyme required for sulfatase activity